MRAQNPKRSKACGPYRHKLRSTNFSARFEPSRRRKPRKTAKNGPYWAVLASIFSTIAPKFITIVTQRAQRLKTVRNPRHGVRTDGPQLSSIYTARRPLFGPKMGFLAPRWAARAPGSPKSDFSARTYLQNQATPGRTNYPSKPWFWW